MNKLRYFLYSIYLVSAVGCTERVKDHDILLTTTSMFGSTVWIASFNGNSSDKNGDCTMVAEPLNKLYPARGYRCEYAKDVLVRIKREEKQ